MAKIYTPIPNLKFNDGNSIPMLTSNLLGFGLGTAWYKSSEGDLDTALVESCKTAIGMGYYHIDGAEVYKTEREQGKAIKESGIPREKLFITTKNLNGKDVAADLKTSLSKLGLDYVDLYLLHKPWIGKDEKGDPADLQAAWKQMEEVRDQGLSKSIGVSNFLPEHLSAILETAKVPPAINQIEFHAYLQQTPSLEFHKKHGIATAAYGPLTPVTKASGGPIDEYVGTLAHKYAVTPGEILLRWCVDQDVVAITTSGKEQRLSDYLRAMTFKLTPKEIKELNEAGAQKHFRAFWKVKYPDGN